MLAPLRPRRRRSSRPSVLVDRGLVGVLAGRERERALPDLVVRVERQLGLVAVRLPVARATHLAVVVAGHGRRWPAGSTGPAPAATATGVGASPTTPYDVVAERLPLRSP